MSSVTEIIESGVLELFVMGAASKEEALEVERLAAAHPEIRQELEEISRTLENYALEHAVEPSPRVKPVLLATIDYMTRMQEGEPMTYPPVLTESSSIADFEPWLNQEDLQHPDEQEDIFVKIIGYSQQATTAIVWIKDMKYSEVHDDELESFLIVEGSCDVVLGEEIRSLRPGDYLAIPLHTPHTIKVTSDIPCKAILQRLAA
jgi:mannose-6-phosphate isomerase-like protein (cupin superfamily)